MSADTPAIAIPCYNRINSLKRLLKSLETAEYGESNGNVPLVLCVDFSEAPSVRNFAESYKWPFGKVEVITNSRNIGLRENVLQCGDLTRTYKNVIVLEDDSIVSPCFYGYAKAILKNYSNSTSVSQFSLYAYDYTEVGDYRFYPSYTGSDVFLMKWTSSRGQIWTDKQWDRFRIWYSKNKEIGFNNTPIPDIVKSWSSQSWKKYFICYQLLENLYTLYPYRSYVTNSGDIGQHMTKMDRPLVQSPLVLDEDSKLRLPEAINDLPKYDTFFEIEKQTLDKLTKGAFSTYDYSVDLLASKNKSVIKSPYLFSSRKCRNPIKQFGWSLFPLENNIIYDFPGNKISFGKTTDFDFKMSAVRKSKLSIWLKQQITWKRATLYSILRGLSK